MTRKPVPESAHLRPLLEDILRRLGVAIRHEPLRTESGLPPPVGGLCRIKGLPVLFIDPAVPSNQAVEIIISALKQMNTDDIYLPPAVRDRLDAP